MKTISLVLLSVIFSILNTNAQTVTKPYDFPVKPGSVEWKQLNTHNEMINATQLPEDFLKSVNTVDLLQTCLNYPLLFDMYAYDNLKIGFDEMSKNFNGFLSLKKRKDAATVIIEKYKSINAQTVATLKSEEDKGKFTMLLSAIEILIANDHILNQLGETPKKDILIEILKKNQGKEQYKGVFGSMGTLTLAYTASRVLDSLADPSWKLYIESNPNAKKFSDSMILSDQNILNNVFLNAQRISNK